MKKTMFKLILVLMSTAFSGCGGGDVELVEPKGGDFSTTGETSDVTDPGGLLTEAITSDVLQSLNMQSDRVAVLALARSDLTTVWRDALQLNYVMLGAHGDILGQAVAKLPDRAEFAANGTAYMAVTTISDNYVLRQGDIYAVLDIPNAGLEVELQWSDDEIQLSSETLATATPQNFNANIKVVSYGLAECGADNLMCGGQIIFETDGVKSPAGTDLDKENAVFGVFGTGDKSAEIGGRIVYIREDELSVIGGFVAGRK